jgi:hypothetical protein
MKEDAAGGVQGERFWVGEISCKKYRDSSASLGMTVFGARGIALAPCEETQGFPFDFAQGRLSALFGMMAAGDWASSSECWAFD